MIQRKNQTRASKNLKQKLTTGSLLVLCLFATSCLPELQEKPPTTDHEVSVNAVAQALEDAMGSSTPVTLNVGKKVLYESNYRVETSQPNVIAYTITELIGKTETATQYHLTFKETTEDVSDTPTKVVEKESTMDIDKSPVPASVQSLSTDDLVENFQTSRGEVQTQADVDHTTFHELKVNRTKSPYPNGCGPNPDCSIDITEVSFAVIDWYTDGTFAKTFMVYRFSKEIPRLHKVWSDNLWAVFSSASISYCQSMLYPQNGRNLLVTFCDVMKDEQ